jgi:hypothetical protein
MYGLSGKLGREEVIGMGPELKGLWRVTKLPFGANAFDGFHVLGIPKPAKIKRQPLNL